MLLAAAVLILTQRDLRDLRMSGMRNTLSFVFLLAVASPLAASWYWTPDDVHLVAGRSTTVTVRFVFTGLLPWPQPSETTFRSDDESVAIANVRIVDKATHEVEIRAVGPGAARIRTYDGGKFGDWAWVHIKVVCEQEAPVSPVFPVLRASIGVPVMIAVDSAWPDRTVFTWYCGRQGDRSQPIAASGPAITFTPDTYGTQYVWVSATTSCSESATEVRIDVPPARRRAG